MLVSHSMIFYVQSAADSTPLYERLLGAAPVMNTPTFVMFALPAGGRLGLWSQHAVLPAVDGAAVGGSELALTLAQREHVDAMCADWRAQGLTIAQAPVDVDFGYAAVAIDRDGQRIRAFAPSAA